MPSWNQDLEFITPVELEKLQLTRLKESIQKAEKAPFYRRCLAELGLSQDNLKSIKDIARFPFTTKEDLRSGRPEDFLAVSSSKVVRLHASSGTTGAPTAVYHTQSDLDHWTNLMARCLCMIGITPEDVFQNMVGYGLFTGGLGMHYGAERLGATVIPAGVGNTRRQINIMKQFGTTLVHMIPNYAFRLWEHFELTGLSPQKDLALNKAILGAEPHSEGTRRRVEEMFGVKAFNSYGLSEMNGPGVGFECPNQAGLHIWEDEFFLEIVHPETLTPLPPGNMGEIVLTTLCREAMPLIRYRTRDLAMIIPEACPCGRTHRRLSRIQGRTDDMFIIKGVNVFPVQVERILMDLEEASAHFLILLNREGSQDTMTVRVEMGPGLVDRLPEEVKSFETRIARLLKDELLVSPRVELVDPGLLPRAEGKAVRVQDMRPQEA